MMPRGPRSEKRPADDAVKVMRIATGEETEELETNYAKGLSQD
jgi:hypothetical protein